MGKDSRLVVELSAFDRYSHEFGHNIGLVHQFIDPNNPLRGNISMEVIQNNKGRHVGVDGIMIKNKMAENETLGCYLSSLSRYVFKPINGYEDDGKFGTVYSSLYSREVFESIRERVCGE